MLAVQTTAVNKDFPAGDSTVHVLHDINIHVQYGALSMLVGPSGCGKTTLLSIITGILSPTSGSVVVDGVDITRLNDLEKVIFRRERLGFIFQQYHLLPSLNAMENAAVPLLAAGLHRGDALDRAAQILKQIGMGDQLYKTPRHLSGGQQQRVAIARALVHEPKVIVCDEPTAALDEQTGLAVMKILKDRALQQDRAVIVVTHDNRIYPFADHLFRMNDGRIVSSDARLPGATA